MVLFTTQIPEEVVEAIKWQAATTEEGIKAYRESVLTAIEEAGSAAWSEHP